ncbi:glycosyltransferase involved in cell wall biosynthesis [Micromonospora luteifusca]|uniref:Glycosyltransferase involved in cell wall biosynthesis n=1 Tax=Micromonospora luteifusca TaxID=709860 RepID=A0ABS2M129_9ACTN|nr:glycosyltransferase family 4 protein [Micromonospora luteifusca]MBM7493639.1 glycosyltransferase involved in cell wall biosynthesis [Micromonospora luteifusca]
MKSSNLSIGQNGPNRPPVRSRPVVVQHSAGRPGANGPLTAVERVLASPLAERYEFVRMHQVGGNGALNTSLLREWIPLLRRVRPDVVHVRGLQNEGFHAVLAARMAGCPRILVTVHGTVRDLRHVGPSWRRRLLVHGAEPATLRMASHVATVCEYAAGRDFVRQQAEKFVGVIPNGVPVPADPSAARSRARAALGMAEDDVVMITVARLTWDKGFRVLADALCRLPPQVGRRVLLIAGDGPDRSGIAAALARVGGTEVRLLGNRLDVPDLLSAADVFVFPTLHENLSNALLEAMAHALPVVASAVGGNVEVLRSGGGRLVPAGDAGELAAALWPLLADAGERRHMGQTGYKVVHDGYSLQVMLGALDGVYRRMLEGEA